MPSKFCILGSKRAINMAISLPECTHFALSYSSIRLYKALLATFRSYFYNILESWWYIGFEGNSGVKSRETRVE